MKTHQLILFLIVALGCTSCDGSYEFAKRECAARKSQLKNWIRDFTGGSFSCEDGFRYNE